MTNNKQMENASQGYFTNYGSLLSDALLSKTTASYMKKGEIDMQETQEVLTIDSLVDRQDLREKLIGRVETLDKVKKLFMIPGLDMVSTMQIADYFEVDYATIYKCFNRNRDEITSDGIVQKTSKEVRSGHDVHIEKMRKNHGVEVALADGTTAFLNNTKSYYFSTRAVLRFAMFLRDSAVAKEIRTQLINVYQGTSVEDRIKSLTEEQDFMYDAIKGLEDNDIERSLQAMVKMVQFGKRHQKAAEELMVKNAELASSNANLESSNADLELTNNTLSREALTTDPRKLVCRIIRSYANLRQYGNHSKAWAEFYQRLSYQAGINVKTRKGFKGSWMDVIQDDEWPDCIRVASAMCNSSGLDVGRIVRETNTEVYSHLISFNSNERLGRVTA